MFGVYHCVAVRGNGFVLCGIEELFCIWCLPLWCCERGWLCVAGCLHLAAGTCDDLWQSNSYTEPPATDTVCLHGALVRE